MRIFIDVWTGRICARKMNGKWLAERLLNGPFRGQETKEMELMRVTPDSVGGNTPKPPAIAKLSESPKNGGAATLTLKQFLDKYSLPRIVKIVPEEPIAATEFSDPAALLNCTLLLYRQYRSGKIEAKKFHDPRNVKLVVDSSNLKDVASTIVIPDTYQGWFSVMTERGQVKARQYTTVQRLIAAQVTAFLIIGPDIIGYYQNHHKTADGARSRHQYIKTVIRSGQILKLLAVYEDIAEQSTRTKRLSWPLLGSKQQSTQYAQCMTVKKQIVYVPITTHGCFYAVSTANNTAEDNVSKVYQIAKLLQVFPLPVRVCSIYPQKINGSILLETYHKEDVMLACVLDDKLSSSSKCRFLEIDVNSKFFVNLVTDEQRLFKKARIQKALRSCQVDSEKWCQQLKVIHHIYPSKQQMQQQQLHQQHQHQQHQSDSQDSQKPSKRARKLSLGDKKTVKSASFRFSTSYGVEETKAAPYRNLAPVCGVSAVQAVAATTKPATSHPPVYLNIAQHPNEENCSSLPTQKSDRSVFENEILQSVLRNQNGVIAESPNGSKGSSGGAVAVDDRRQWPKAAALPPFARSKILDSCTSGSGSSISGSSYQKLMVTSRSSSSSVVSSSECKARITKVDDVERLMRSKLHVQQTRLHQPRNHQQDMRYRVVKKENTYVERDLSMVPRQPVYKTQVMVKIDDSYSDAIDAIRERHSSKDNIYAEINEYHPAQLGGGYVIFPQTKSCFVNENCSSSYIRVPSTSTVNVS